MKTSTKFYAGAASALALLACIVAETPAGVISITQATLTSDSQIANGGVYVSGTNLINANVAETVNGVLFKATASGSYFEGPANTPGTFRYLNGSAATSTIYPGGSFSTSLNTLLDSAVFGDAAVDIAVVGLNPSNVYRLQLLMGDNRNFSSSENWAIRAGTFTPNGGIGTYVSGSTLGMFSVNTLGRAGSHTAEIDTIYFTGQSAIDIAATGGGQALLNGMALFVVPEPSSMISLLLGAVGLLWQFGRKRRK